MTIKVGDPVKIIGKQHGCYGEKFIVDELDSFAETVLLAGHALIVHAKLEDVEKVETNTPEFALDELVEVSDNEDFSISFFRYFLFDARKSIHYKKDSFPIRVINDKDMTTVFEYVRKAMTTVVIDGITYNVKPDQVSVIEEIKKHPVKPAKCSLS